MPFFHCFPLIVNIERQRFGNAFTVRQFRLAGNNKAEARYSLNALIGAADKEIDTQLLHIQRYTAKAAHGIYNQFLAVHLYNMAISFNGFSTPVVVSQCTTDTCVISALCAK